MFANEDMYETWRNTPDKPIKNTGMMNNDQNTQTAQNPPCFIHSVSHSYYLIINNLKLYKNGNN